MRSIILFAFLIPFGISQFIVLPDNHEASVEKRSEIQTTCTIIDIFPNPDSPFYLEKMFTNVCKAPNHTVPEMNELNRAYVLENDYRRTSTFERFLERSFGQQHREPFLDVMKRFGHENIAKLASLLASDNIQENFTFVSEVLSWNGTELVKFFKYRDDKVNDAWEAMESKQLQCNQVNKLELHVCGNINERRQFGDHKFVATLGMFSSRGSIYKYLDIPSHAVELNGKISTVESCRFLATYYECYSLRNTKCTVHDYSNCTEIAKLSTSKVLATHYDEYIVVAADVDIYETMVNNTVASHHMDHSKHVVLRLPKGTYAKFNNIKVYGNATHGYDHFAVHYAGVHSSNITVNDLDALRELHGNHEEIEIHRSMVVEESGNSLISIIFWCVLVIILLMAVIGLFIIHSRSVRQKEAIHEPFVIYKAEELHFEY